MCVIVCTVNEIAWSKARISAPISTIPGKASFVQAACRQSLMPGLPWMFSPPPVVLGRPAGWGKRAIADIFSRTHQPRKSCRA